jgi:hypothetical protein
MQKTLLAIAAAFSCLIATSGGAISAPYAFGDEPYTLNWGYYSQIEKGCWRWNWQQYQYNDTCPVYVHPKAYMYPRSNVVLRTKG